MLKSAFLAGTFSTVILAASEPAISIEFDTLPPLDETQRVLATKLVRLGKDTLTYTRVTPPAVSFSASENVQLVKAIVPLLSETEEPVRGYRYFCCSIVPYPFGVSEIQWSDEAGHQKRIFVHDDLTYLGFSFGVRVDDCDYDYTTLNYGGYGTAQLSDFPADIQGYIATARNLPGGEFLAVPAATNKLIPLTEAESDAIDIMLAYYQIHHDALKAAREVAIAQAEAEAEAKRIRNLNPKAMEIRLWPVISQRYSTVK